MGPAGGSSPRDHNAIFSEYFGFRNKMAARPPDLEPRTAEDHLGESLLRLARAQMRILRREAAAEGISMPQFFALNWVARCGPVPTTDWAARMGTSPSTVTGLFDGLERDGHIIRRADPGDRRRILVTVRPKARALVARVDARRRARVARACEGITPRERDAAAGLLETLAARLEGTADTDPRAPPPPRSGTRRVRRAVHVAANARPVPPGGAA